MDILKRSQTKSKMDKKHGNIYCGGEHRTEKASCPYPSNKDTLWQKNVEDGYITLLSGEKHAPANSDLFKTFPFLSLIKNFSFKYFGLKFFVILITGFSDALW